MFLSRNLKYDNSNYLSSVLFSIFRFPDASGNDKILFVSSLKQHFEKLRTWVNFFVKFVI